MYPGWFSIMWVTATRQIDWVPHPYQQGTQILGSEREYRNWTIDGNRLVQHVLEIRWDDHSQWPTRTEIDPCLLNLKDVCFFTFWSFKLAWTRSQGFTFQFSRVVISNSPTWGGMVQLSQVCCFNAMFVKWEVLNKGKVLMLKRRGEMGNALD